MRPYSRIAADFLPFLQLRCLTLFFCLLPGLFLLPGCAPRQADDPPPFAERFDAGTWLFRHKVRLDFPNQNMTHSFDGLMRLDTRAETIHVAGVAGLGMQMFDMTITRNGETVVYMHPALAKMPGAAKHMARCIRQIWLDCLLNTFQNTSVEQKTWSLTTSGDKDAGLWPRVMNYSNKRVPFTLTVRLLQAQQEDAL